MGPSSEIHLPMLMSLALSTSALDPVTHQEEPKHCRELELSRDMASTTEPPLYTATALLL